VEIVIEHGDDDGDHKVITFRELYCGYYKDCLVDKYNLPDKLVEIFPVIELEDFSGRIVEIDGKQNTTSFESELADGACSAFHFPDDRALEDTDPLLLFGGLIKSDKIKNDDNHDDDLDRVMKIIPEHTVPYRCVIRRIVFDDHSK